MSLLSQQLQAFVAITECKTVNGAAEKLFLTQTAVTQRIRGLETNLKTTLFIRSRRGMLLTAEGEALLRYCLAAKELEGEALAVIQGAGVQTEIELSITGPSSIMRSRIIPSCLTVMNRFPFLLMEFDINDTDNLHQSLRSGQHDFAVLEQGDVVKEMASKKLKDEQYILVASAQWKGRRLKEIIKNERIVDFNVNDQETFNYLKHFQLFDDAQHSRHFANRIESLAMMVIEGLGYTTLAKTFAKPYIDSGQLIVLNGGKVYSHQPVLAWYERPERPEYFDAIIQAID